MRNPVEVILNIFWKPGESSEHLTQESANAILWEIVGRLDLHEQGEAVKMIEGGVCDECKTPYAEKKANPKLGDFIYFVPRCNCLNTEKTEKSEKKSIRIKYREKIFQDANIPPVFWNKTFENYDKENVGPGIKKPVMILRKYINEKKYWTKGLIFYGDVGTGKTHLAIGILKWLMIEHGVRGYYFRMADLLNMYFNHGQRFEKILEERKFFVLDDIDKIGDTVMKDERLYSLIDKLYADEKIIFVTGNFNSLGELPKKLTAPVTSRILGMCYNEALEFRGEDRR